MPDDFLPYRLCGPGINNVNIQLPGGGGGDAAYRIHAAGVTPQISSFWKHCPRTHKYLCTSRHKSCHCPHSLCVFMWCTSAVCNIYLYNIAYSRRTIGCGPWGLGLLVMSLSFIRCNCGSGSKRMPCCFN